MEQSNDDFTPCVECAENEAVTPQGYCEDCNGKFFSNSDS